MKSVKKVLISLWLVAALVTSTLPVEAFAAEEVTASSDMQIEAEEEVSEQEQELSNAGESMEIEGSTEIECSTASENSAFEETIVEETTTAHENFPEEGIETETESTEIETEKVETETEINTEEAENLDIQETVEKDTDSTAAKHSIVATVDQSGKFDITAEEVLFSNKKVLLIQDSIPWSDERNDIDSNQVILSQLAPYDVTSTKKFPSMDVSDYAVIIFANDQAIETYTNYARFRDKMEEYAERGGVIVFGAADGGWANGDLSAALPGGVTKTSLCEYRNYIEDHNHPIVTGQLTGGEGLTDSDLYSTYCSHVYFDKNSLPNGTRVILKNQAGNPTLIEYPLGRGRVIASGLTWEHNYVYGGTSSKFNRFAAKAMKDYYTYALYISGISNDNLEILLDETIKEDEHLVLLADSVTKDPIKGASVTLGMTTVQTDKDGRAWFREVEEGGKMCVIKADGYQTKFAYYNVTGGSMRYFFITPKANSDAYITGALIKVTETNKDGSTNTKTYDLMQDKINIQKSKKYEVELSGDWNGQNEGWYVLCNDTQIAYSKDGKFTFEDGKCSNSKGEKVAFEDGRIYARMISAEGNRSKLADLLLYARKNSEGDLFGKDNNGLFSIGKKFGFTVPDKYPVIGNMDFSISLDKLPVCYEVSEGEIKIAIGIKDFTQFKNPKTSWEDYKKNFEVVKRTKNLAEMKKKFGAKAGAMTLKKDLDTDFDAVGYAVGKFNEETGEITEISGELVISFELMYKYNQQFVVGPVPIYFEIGGGFSIENTSKVRGVLTDTGQLILDDTLTLTPKFVLGGGVGINGALSAGAEGEASLPIVLFNEKWNATENKNEIYANVSLAGEMKLKASLLFVFNAEKSIAKGEWQLLRYYYDTGELELFEADGLDAQEAAIDLTDVSSYHLSSRSYLKNASEWYTNDMEAAEFQNGMTVLKRGVLDTSTPQITRIDNDAALMVFQEDATQRSSINRSRLMYSLNTNGVWSKPAPVWDNGCADMAASVVSGNDGTYVVWQKANAKLDDSSNSEQLAAACEIAVAKYDIDSNSFIEQKYITSDSRLQMMPVAVSGEDDAYALYVENSSNNLLGGGTYTIKARNLKSGTTKNLYSGSEYVTALDAEIIQGDLCAAITLDHDGDMNTTTDTDVYCYQNNTCKRITNDEAAQLNAQYCGDTIYWYQNESNAIYGYDGNNVNLVAEDTAIGTNFKMMETNGKLAITWIGVTAEGKDCIFAKIKNGGEWSDVVEIITTDNLKQFGGYIGNNRKWEIIALTEEENGETALLYSGVVPHLKTSVSNIAITERNRNDLYYKVMADFNNQSEEALSNLKVDFLDMDGSLEFSRNIQCCLKGGEKKKLDFEVDIPVQKQLTSYIIRIYPEGENDLTDNEGTVTLGYSDIVISLDRYESGNINVLTANIYNDSDIASDVTLTVRADDPEEGIIADIVNIEALESGKTRTFNYSYDLTKMDFGDKASKTYFYIITSHAKESDETNNIASITFLNPFYTEDGEPAIPTGIKLNVPDPIMLKVDTVNTYKIEAEVTPKSASRWPLQYISSDTGVVKVDEDGLLHAVSEGTATIIVRAVDTKIQKVINVAVGAMEGAELVMELEDCSAKTTTGYQVQDIWQIKIYSNKSEESLDASVFTYASDNEDIAAVDKNGKVTFKAAGNVTLTAVYNKNTEFRASKSIVVENEKIGSIQLKYTRNGTEYNAEDLYTTLSDYQYTPIVLFAECYAENGNRLEENNLVYTSNNKAVATIDPNGKVIITGKEGVTVLSVKAEGSDAFSEMSLYVYKTYAPSLVSDASIKVNINSSEGTLIELMPMAEGGISDYEPYLYTKGKKGNYTYNYDFTVSHYDEYGNEIIRESGTYGYRIVASVSKPKGGTYYIKTYLGRNSYYTPIKISTENKMPKVKISTQKFNAFIKDTSGALVIDADAAIESVSFLEVYNKSNRKLSRNGFTMSRDASGKYQISTTSTLRNALARGTKLNKFNHQYKVYVFLSGYKNPVEKTIKVSAQYKVPSVKLSKNSFTADSSGSCYAASVLSIKDVGAKSYTKDLSDVTVTTSVEGMSSLSTVVTDAENGLITIRLPQELENKKSGVIKVRRSNWVTSVNAKIKVTGKMKADYKIDKTAKVNVVTKEPSVVNLSVKGGQNVLLKDSTLVEDDLFKITTDYNGITIIPTALTEEYTQKTYSYQLALESADFVPMGSYNLKISVEKKNVVIQTEDEMLYLDVSQRGRTLHTSIKGNIGVPYDTKKTEVVIKDSDNADSTNISAELKEDGVIEIVSQQKISDTYAVIIMPVLKNDVKLSPVRLTVVAGKDTKAETSVKGTLDAMKRTKSSSVVSFRIENNSSKITNVAIQSSYKSNFEILTKDLKPGNASVTVGIKSGMKIKTGTHTIPFLVTLSDGLRVQATADVEVQSSKYKLTGTNKCNMTYNLKNMYAYGTLKVQNAVNTKVLSIEQMDEKSPFRLADNGAGEFYIYAPNKSTLKKGTYKINCRVMAEDQATDTNPVIWQVRVTVK